PASRSAARQASVRRRRRAAVEWVLSVVVAWGAALALRAWVVQAFYIPSRSMVPTLEVGDRILVDKLSYDLHSVHRGDIVVFRRPPADVVDPNIQDLVKRVIGLPGDRISSSVTGQVLIDGKPIPQPWLPPGTAPGPAIRPQVVPSGDYFVMGDNRGDSEDSRFFGPISGKLIVGRVVARIWPVGRIHLFGW
ncbi:MAG: signal peptidase I, partial [Acidimicrobiales bacterium]